MAALFSGNSKGIISRLAHKINRNSHFSAVKFSTKREVFQDLFPKFFKPSADCGFLWQNL